MEEQVTNGLRAAEARRERLRSLMDQLEAALADPPGPDPEAWHSRVAGVVGELDDELQRHVEGTEGPGGLFEDVVTTAPRLGAAVDRVRGEHPGLQERLAELRSTLDDRGPVDSVRRAGIELLTALIVHRQHGADLLYEAYWVDVGGLSG